jgi:DNA-binding FrmR family transcriptional regulator
LPADYGSEHLPKAHQQASPSVHCMAKIGGDHPVKPSWGRRLQYPIQGDRILLMNTHTSHPGIIKRLKRAEGHLRSIITMLENDRGCLAIAQQLQAVERAVASAKKTLVHDHIDHCLEHAVRAGSRTADDTIREFKELSKYL